MAIWIGMLGTPDGASAHAAYERSEPEANSVVPTAPAEVRIWFTEPLERAYSSAILYDGTGSEVQGTRSEVASGDPYQLTLALPPGLANGTYTVAWKNISAADGHGQQGFFAFTIGTAADVGQAAAVATPDGGPPAWLQSLSRWSALVGLAAAVAIWPIWLVVLRPSVASMPPFGERAAIRAQWLAIAALLAALAGNVFALLVQAAGTGDESLGVAVWTTVTETRYGRFWLLRVVLLAAFATTLSWARWWPRSGKDVAGIMALALAAALPFPFSMVSHAAAQTDGRATAIAFDLVHLLGAAVWIGGLYALAGVLLPAMRDAPPGTRRPILASAIPRFSAIALAAWGAMAVTGIYTAWLQVGSLEALTETAYGQSLLAKLILIVPLLGLGALNLLVVGPHTRRPTGEMDAGAGRWSRRFATFVTAEVVLATALLLIVGRLVGQEPAREELVSRAPDGIAVQLDLATGDEDRPSTLTISPGAAGPNAYRLEVGGSPLPDGTEAVARLELSEVALGGKQIELTPAGDNTFAGTGSELAIAGDWTAEVIIRKPGELEGRATIDVPVAESGASVGTVDRTTSAWRFEWPGTVGLIFIVVGLMGLVAAWAAGRSPNRFRAGLGGTAAICLGAILLIGARIPPAEATLGGRPSETASGVGFGTPVSASDLAITLEPAALQFGANTLSFLITDEAGEPVTDATVTVEPRMLDMEMPPTYAEAAMAEPGRYVIDGVLFDMLGGWEVTVTVERDGREPVTVPFLVEVDG